MGSAVDLDGVMHEHMEEEEATKREMVAVAVAATPEGGQKALSVASGSRTAAGASAVLQLQKEPEQKSGCALRSRTIDYRRCCQPPLFLHD